MTSPKLLTAVILTANEERHIERCIRSIQPLCDRIVVIDSESTDATADICKRLGAEVLVRRWPNKYADQLNWGIQHSKATTPWMLRIDADEYLSEELQQEVAQKLPTLEQSVSGLVMPRLVMFQNKPILHGGFYPQWLLRIWRTNLGHCEDRMMDEHMVVTEGSLVRLKGNLIDHNLNDIHWWTNKHNNYARREAADLIGITHGLFRDDADSQKTERHAALKRWVKTRVYAPLPLGFRATSYLAYRMLFRFGFLDHPRVWVFHALQAGWYRTLVDVNIQEFEDAVGKAGLDAQVRFLRERWKIRIP